jgi:hypothetical protein
LFLLDLIEPRILDGDRGLIGKCLQPIGILWPEETRRPALQINEP